MLLQPADFYSYSRATGTKPPENDRERAAVAADVIDFKRNQLRAPSPEDNEGRDIGLVALGAGILGSIIGGKKISERFRGTQAPPKKVSFDPGPETKKAARRANQRNNQKLQKDLSEVKPSKIVESPTVVEKQQIDNTSTSTEQVKNRAVTEQVNRDVQSVREGKTNELKAEAIIKARQNSDFANFSQDAVKLKQELATQKAAIAKLEDQIFTQEAKEQAFARSAVEAMQDVQAPMAFGLTGRASDMGLSKKELRRLGLKGDEQFFGPDLSEKERIQRISLAGDDRISERQRRMLLDPSVSSKELTKQGLLDLGEFPSNPDFEIRAGGTSDPTIGYKTAPSSGDLTMGESNIAEDKLDYIQKQRLEKMGAAGITGVAEGPNPEYTRLNVEFSKKWDELAAKNIVLPRRQVIDGQEFTYQQLKDQVLTNPNPDPILKAQFEQSGQLLNMVARGIGLDKVPKTSINVENAPFLKEVITTPEVGRKGTKTILTDLTDYNSMGTLADTEAQKRLERQTRREDLRSTVTPIRPQGSIVYDETGKATFVPSRVSPAGKGAAAQVGGYKTGEPIQYYEFDKTDNVKVSIPETDNLGKPLKDYQKNVMTPMLKTPAGGPDIPIGTIDSFALKKVPMKTFDISEDVLNIQPYSVTKITKDKDVINTAIYGPLYELVSTKNPKTQKVEQSLRRTQVSLTAMQDLASRTRASIPENILSEDPKTYYAKIADKLYEDTKRELKKDLPVLKDPKAKSQFAKDLLNVEKENVAYGKPATGKTFLGRYTGIKGEKKPIPGVYSTSGFGSVVGKTKYETDEAGKIRVDIGGGQRAAGAQKLRQALQDFKTRTGKPVSRSQLFKLAQPLARQYNTDINSLINLAGSRRGGGLRG
jgi:hypothetical protein